MVLIRVAIIVVALACNSSGDMMSLAALAAVVATSYVSGLQLRTCRAMRCGLRFRLL